MKSFQAFLSESKTSMKEFEELVNLFLPYALKELRMKTKPPIRFLYRKNCSYDKEFNGITIIHDCEFSKSNGTFGQINHKNQITVNIKNRHPLDSLRTLAHEMVHYQQQMNGIYGTGKTGSPTENEANAKAAIIMRNFAQDYSELFKRKSL